MKRILLSLPLVLLCSCSTPQKTQELASVLGQAANFGAQAYLASHPEARPAFDAAIALLAAFQRGGGTNSVELAGALSRLPVALSAPAVGKEVYMTDGLVLYDQRTAKAQRVLDVKKPSRVVVREFRRGLAQAVAPKPPVPARHAAVVPAI